MNMKINLPRLFPLLGLCTVLAVQAADDSQDSVTAIEVDAVTQFVAEHDDAVILDVRTPIEFEMSHITGSVNADVQDESFEAMLAELDPTKKYIVQCTANPAGGRSSRALESMQKMGFKHLYSLQGGYVAWKAAELPLTEASY